MAGRSVYITEKEADAISEAIDFISTNADGAEDFELFVELQEKLQDVWKKWGSARQRRAR